MSTGPAAPPDTALDAQLDAWRAEGAQRIDPLRFDLLDALARRAAALQGLVRRRLDERLVQLAADYAQAVARAGAGGAAPVPGTPRSNPLRELLDRLPVADGAAPVPKTVQAHRATWSRLATEQRLRAALARVPENAGPLNTQRLLHEALQLLRERAPDMLQHLVGYVDALLWLDGAVGATPPAAAPPSVTPPSTRRRRP